MGTLQKIASGKNVLMLLMLFLFFNLVIISAFCPKSQALDTLPS